MIKNNIISFCLSFISIFVISCGNSFADIPQPTGKIPSAIVSLSSGFVIIVDKQYQKIYVFQKNGTFSKVFEAPCSTGKNPGGKQVSGDAKTPNGIYFATRMIRNPGPPEIYGTMAFPLDYPTIIDRKSGRNGTNIWIHGTTKPLLPLQSNGCVVLRDSDLQQLASFIQFNKTPVIIAEFLKWVPQQQVSAEKNELERILKSWNAAFISSDMATIDSLYLSGAQIKGKKREDVANKIKSLKSINKHFILQPRDISILEHDNTAVILFDQISSINSDNSFTGSYNKLVLEKTNNKWYILDDITAPAPITMAAQKKTSDKEYIQQETKSTSSEAVEALVNKWVNSWKSGDMKVYRSCYASSFRSKSMNLNDWVAHKTDVRQRNKGISIRIDNLRTKADNNTASAIFTQHYSSPALKSKGTKKLELKKVNGEWKIIRETMQ